jgi:lipopolysaccharide export system permease protein
MLRTDPKLFGDNRMMRSRDQLQAGIDSIERKIKRERTSQKKLVRFTKSNHLNGNALDRVRDVKQQLSASNESIKTYTQAQVGYAVQRHRILTNAAACFIMFLIGAPLGSIIRKGGLGSPVLLSIVFFLIYFVVDIQAEELAQSGTLPVAVSMWLANMSLLLYGLYFLFSARNDSRLFDADLYHSSVDRIVQKFS